MKVDWYKFYDRVEVTVYGGAVTLGLLWGVAQIYNQWPSSAEPLPSASEASISQPNSLSLE